MHNFYSTPIKPEQLQSLFCCHCGAERDGISDIMAHLKAAHNEKFPQAGDDYLSGASILRNQRELAREIEHFGDSIDSLRGADDFLLECGDA